MLIKGRRWGTVKVLIFLPIKFLMSKFVQIKVYNFPQFMGRRRKYGEAGQKKNRLRTTRQLGDPITLYLDNSIHRHRQLRQDFCSRALFFLEILF